MTKRVLTAAVAGSLAVAVVLLLDSHLFFWVALLLVVGCTFEYAALARRVHADFPRPLLLIAVPVVASTWLLPASTAPPLLPLRVARRRPAAVRRRAARSAPTPRQAVGSLGWASFGLPYLVLPIWSLYELHRLDSRLLLVLLVSVWANDSMALLVGSTWGRRKLAPRLSPNKTWEGAVGGLLGSAAVGWGGLALIGAEPRWQILGILLVAAIAAQLGDLVESMLKRAAEVKDSGTLMPGHGGLLDRLDAIILAGPVFYGLLEATGLAVGL